MKDESHPLYFFILKAFAAELERLHGHAVNLEEMLAEARESIKKLTKDLESYKQLFREIIDAEENGESVLKRIVKVATKMGPLAQIAMMLLRSQFGGHIPLS